ncbi:hypothetical protein K438DRAFT_1761561 [Mycena galopus ATCC 62051]|nr:hypothetical protein K438DRAFT_1761561 [Mycena galopus ATCC 62051]
MNSSVLERRMVPEKEALRAMEGKLFGFKKRNGGRSVENGSANRGLKGCVGSIPGSELASCRDNFHKYLVFWFDSQYQRLSRFETLTGSSTRHGPQKEHQLSQGLRPRNGGREQARDELESRKLPPLKPQVVFLLSSEMELQISGSHWVLPFIRLISDRPAWYDIDLARALRGEEHLRTTVLTTNAKILENISEIEGGTGQTWLNQHWKEKASEMAGAQFSKFSDRNTLTGDAGIKL